MNYAYLIDLKDFSELAQVVQYKGAIDTIDAPWRYTYEQDKTMNMKKVENGLALLGALIVLLGVTAAANTALADEASVSGLALISEIATSDKK